MAKTGLKRVTAILLALVMMCSFALMSSAAGLPGLGVTVCGVDGDIMHVLIDVDGDYALDTSQLVNDLNNTTRYVVKNSSGTAIAVTGVEWGGLPTANWKDSYSPVGYPTPGHRALKFASPLPDGYYSITINMIDYDDVEYEPVTIDFIVGDLPATTAPTAGGTTKAAATTKAGGTTKAGTSPVTGSSIPFALVAAAIMAGGVGVALSIKRKATNV